ncbi:MAG: iron ABC transporter substrate-binding protein [Actinomycetota bacterium]
MIFIRQRRTSGLVATIAVALALVATACSSGDENALTIYSGRSEDLVQPLIDQFTDETGIEVTVRYAGSADLAATILEEGERSPADLFYAQDPASLGSVALAGLFTELDADVIAAVPQRFSDTSGRWAGVSGRARVVVYDSATIDPAILPESEDGFTDSEWAGRVGIAPTNGSFLSFVAAKILADGEDATLTWLEAMKANSSPTYAKNSPIVAAVNAGEIDAGLVNHYYLLRALAENPNETGRNSFFAIPTAGSLVMPSGIGMLETSQNKDAAAQFIRFLHTTAAQEYFAEETFEYPLVPGIPANEQLPAIDTIPTPTIDLSNLASVLDRATDLVAEAGLI